LYFTIKQLCFTTVCLYFTQSFLFTMKSLSQTPRNIGRNIERIREIRGMKQDTLAQALGVSQQTVSKIEQSGNVEEDKLAQIADALGVSSETIKNFNEDAAINNIHTNHTFNDSSSLNNNVHCTFNPLEKLIDVIEENKKLYERLLKEKDAVIEMYKKQQQTS
jgi:transcriptional regulator with XRE-family HTH domain